QHFGADGVQGQGRAEGLGRQQRRAPDGNRRAQGQGDGTIRLQLGQRHRRDRGDEGAEEGGEAEEGLTSRRSKSAEWQALRLRTMTGESLGGCLLHRALTRGLPFRAPSATVAQTVSPLTKLTSAILFKTTLTLTPFRRRMLCGSALSEGAASSAR